MYTASLPCTPHEAVLCVSTCIVQFHEWVHSDFSFFSAAVVSQHWRKSHQQVSWYWTTGYIYSLAPPRHSKDAAEPRPDITISSVITGASASPDCRYISRRIVNKSYLGNNFDIVLSRLYCGCFVARSIHISDYCLFVSNIKIFSPHNW